MNPRPPIAPRCRKVGYVLSCRVNGRKKFKALGQIDTTAPTLCVDDLARENRLRHTMTPPPMQVEKPI